MELENLLLSNLSFTTLRNKGEQGLQERVLGKKAGRKKLRREGDKASGKGGGGRG